MGAKTKARGSGEIQNENFDKELKRTCMVNIRKELKILGLTFSLEKGLRRDFEKFEKKIKEAQKTFTPEKGGNEVKYWVFNPEKKTSKPPVLFVGGWGNTAGVYGLRIQQLLKSGRKVIYANPTEGVPTKKLKFSKNTGIDEIFIPKANELQAILEKENITGDIDFLAHSQGTIVMIAFATLFPEKVKNRKIVFEAPAGIGEVIKNDGLLDIDDESLRAIRLFRRGLNNYMNEMSQIPKSLRRFSRKVLGDSKRYKKKRRYFRLIKVPYAIASINIVPALKKIFLRKNAPQIKILLPDDLLYNPQKTKKSLENAGLPLSIIGGYDCKYGHNVPVYEIEGEPIKYLK